MPCLRVGPLSGERRDFDAHAMGLRIDVGLRGPNSQRSNSAEGSETLEYGVGEGFLEVEAARRGDLFDFISKKIVVPRTLWIIALRSRYILEPDLDTDDEPLRSSNFEFVKSDVGPDFERFQEDPRRTNLERFGNQAVEQHLVHDSPRN
jgi:hypothetical protein